MKRNIFCFFLLCLVLTRFFAFESSASSLDTEQDLAVFSQISATGYLLMDGNTGAVLSEQNADISLPMASTTKIMTCIVALEQGTVSDSVAIPKEAVGVEGSSVYLTKGETLKLEELLYALMLESANDAAVAIAMHISESTQAFAELMNAKASELGMTGTHFVNPHGLPVEGHYSTARDLCKLMQYCMQNEAFRVFTETKTMSISAPEGKSRFLSNHNKLLRLYDGCVGGKTGYTKEAGRCLVSAAEKGGKMLICTTLGAPDDWRDHSSLFDYGFSLYTERVIASASSIKHTIPVVGGTKESVTASNVDSFSLQLRERENVECRVELPHFLYADVKSGDILGEAVYTFNGQEVARLDLVAEDTVDQREEKLSFWKKLLQTVRLWFD